MGVLNTTIEIEGTCPEDDSILQLEVHFTATALPVEHAAPTANSSNPTRRARSPSTRSS
jgi:hypothetical protein